MEDKVTFYTVEALPVNENIDTKGVYFLKPELEEKFSVVIRANDNTKWYQLGLTDAVNSVNGLTGGVKVDLDFDTNTGKLKILATGTGSPVNVAEVDLDARYRKIGDSINWSEISNIPNFALDDNVVHKTGAETIAGLKTFTSLPQGGSGLTPSNARDLTTKHYVDGADTNLQNQINNLTNAVTDGMKTPTDLDCSSNPNYPPTEKGEGYVVTVAGKIGGASGVEVRVGAEIRCKETNAGGTHAAVGDKYYILESDLDQATESVPGFAKVATQTKVDEGEDDKDFVTSKKLQKKIDDELDAADGKYVKEVKVEGNNLTKTNGAVEIPTFSGVAGSNIGLVPPAPGSGDYHLNRKGVWLHAMNQNHLNTNNINPRLIAADLLNSQIDSKVEAAVKWGGENGKIW